MELEKKIQRLKEICSKYETREFLTFIAGILLQMPTRKENPFLEKLMSPMRQLFFLAALNLQKNSEENKIGFSEKEWGDMANLLHEIEMEYFNLLGFPKHGKETTEEIQKIKVTMPTFMNYFFNGPLAYQEQEIERIESVFKTFEPSFIDEWGISISDFINFYDLVNDSVDANLNQAVNFLNPNNWQAFTKKCIEKGIIDPRDWVLEAPEEMNSYINFMKNPGSFLVLNLNKLNYLKISGERFKKILSFFISEPLPNDKIIYYTEENELLKKPFIRINDSEYLVFYSKQYLNACYNFLFDKCLSISRDKILKCRDRFIEDKTERIFRKIFKDEAFFYSNYSIDNGASEQDLLILYKRHAIIIEVKASNYRAPMRDANKAFDKLKSDFKNSIQYAYTQISRVISSFNKSNKVTITNSAGKKLYELNPGKYKTYSIIVTLERLGHIQTNLEDMLVIGDNEDYPWSVNIDDLEAFILTLSKRRNRIQSLFSFLEYRCNFHGHLICSDELEICGSFLKNEKEFKSLSIRDETIVTWSDLTEPIEASYREGMGFENERYLDQKKDKRAFFFI